MKHSRLGLGAVDFISKRRVRPLSPKNVGRFFEEIARIRDGGSIHGKKLRHDTGETPHQPLEVWQVPQFEFAQHPVGMHIVISRHGTRRVSVKAPSSLTNTGLAQANRGHAAVATL